MQLIRAETHCVAALAAVVLNPARGVSSWTSSAGAAAFAATGTQYSKSAIDKTAGAIFMQRMLYHSRRLRMVLPCGMMDAAKFSRFP